MAQTLNKQQKEAVKLIGCPVLIFAGAGSGKTRVLTEKIAYLVDTVGIPPEHILSVTFTNKAANEMKQRILKLIKCDISKMTVGTFHSVCASLRRSIWCTAPSAISLARGGSAWRSGTSRPPAERCRWRTRRMRR